MDLQAFAALTNKIHSPNRQLDTGILPKQQKSRAYKSVETGKPKIQFTMDLWRVGEMRGKWIMRYLPKLPIDVDRRDVSRQQVKDFAEEYMLSLSNEDDEKYINIENASLSKIEYSFDVEKWYRDNFISKIPRYVPPISLHFRYRKDWPRFIYVNAPSSDFNKFLKKTFKEFLDKNKRKLYHRKFKFLKRITSDLFEIRIDFQQMHIIASLKYSVILGSLAAYMMFFHDKEIGPDKEKKLKRDLSRYSDVKKLERYIKRV